RVVVAAQPTTARHTKAVETMNIRLTVVMKFPSNRAGAYRVRSVPVCALTHQSMAAQISGYAVHVALQVAPRSSAGSTSASNRRRKLVRLTKQRFSDRCQLGTGTRADRSTGLPKTQARPEVPPSVTTPIQGAPTTMSGRSRPVSSGTGRVAAAAGDRSLS